MTGHDTEIEKRINAVIGSDTHRLDDLVRLAGINPATDLRFGNWKGINLAGADIRGFDFTGADLTGACFDNARIVGAIFNRANYELPSLQTAVDFDDFIRRECQRTVVRSSYPSDRVLKNLQVFRDSPVCPELVVIPAGSFWMGAQDTESGKHPDEGTRKMITFQRPFAIGRFAVTDAEFRCFLDPHHRKASGLEKLGDALPATGVDWNKAVDYCAWLDNRGGFAPGTYRLPSESEWEYAGRAGTQSEYLWGSRPSSKQANFLSKSVKPVNTFAPNPWGLYQMFGNVWEWCSDVYLGNLDKTPPDGSPCVATSGETERILRGGSWFSRTNTLRSAHRGKPHKGTSESSVGFRVARSLSRH